MNAAEGFGAIQMNDDKDYDVMAEDMPFLSLSQRVSTDDAAESDTLLQTLKPKIHQCVQSKVDNILKVVQKFSDNDKLYLYLQLPPGPRAAEKSNSDVSSVSTAEHMRACNWIRNHLEEHTDTCLPKQDVYDTYTQYCDKLCCRPLSAANFGKIIREIFPNIKARRLGGRGQSKYCYSGIRRRTVVKMPSLPSLDLKTDSTEQTDMVQSYSMDVIKASCALICNWAEKILKRSFNNIVEVAQFLIQQHIISPRCAGAELVMSMVVSEVNENVQRGQKAKVAAPRSDGIEGSESAAESEKIDEKGLKPSTHQQPAEKKTHGEVEKSASTPHVNALMARLPPLRPRVTAGEQPVGCCTFVQSATPVFSSTLATPSIRNSVQISPLPASTLPLTVSTGLNGAGLVSLQKTVPMINVILPSMPVGVAKIQIQPPRTCSETGALGQTDEALTSPMSDTLKSNATKRPLEHHTTSEAKHDSVSKKRRGRPHKVESDSATDAPSPSSDSEKSSRVSVEALQGSATVQGEEYPLDLTAEGSERPAVLSVLKMGQAKSSSASVSGETGRRKDVLRMNETDVIANSKFRGDTRELENRLLPRVDKNIEASIDVIVNSGACLSSYRPRPDEGERPSSMSSISEHNSQTRGSTAELDATHRVIKEPERTEELNSESVRAIHTREEQGSTSQVSVIQDGRHSMQKYISRLAQEAESGICQQGLCQKVEKTSQLTDKTASITEQSSKMKEDYTNRECSKSEPPVNQGRTASSASVLSWGVMPSQESRDPHTDFVYRS